MMYNNNSATLDYGVQLVTMTDLKIGYYQLHDLH